MHASSVWKIGVLIIFFPDTPRVNHDNESLAPNSGDVKMMNSLPKTDRELPRLGARQGSARRARGSSDCCFGLSGEWTRSCRQSLCATAPSIGLNSNFSPPYYRHHTGLFSLPSSQFPSSSSLCAWVRCGEIHNQGGKISWDLKSLNFSWNIQKFMKFKEFII